MQLNEAEELAPTRQTPDWLTCYDSPFPEVPQLVHLARLTIDKTTERIMSAHAHDVLEIQYMQAGAVRWWTEDSSDDVVAGDAYIVRPGELHGGMLNRCTHYTIWLSAPGFGERYFELPSDEATALATSLAHSPARCAPVRQPLGAAFESLLELAETRQRGPDPLLTIEARALLMQILSRIASAGREAVASRSTPSFAAAVIKIVEASLGQSLSSAQIAERMRCSVSQLQHRFHTEFGMTVKHYYLWRRINEACRRLEQTSESVTDIAFYLGFSSSQHFSTTFRRFVGTSPKAYRQGARIPDRDDPWPDPGPGQVAVDPSLHAADPGALPFIHHSRLLNPTGPQRAISS